MSPIESADTSGQQIVLPIQPHETYPNPRASAPTKYVGVEAALKAAEDPSFEVKSTLYSNEFSLAGRVAVVTGGNQGIGMEYSALLAEMGAYTYVLDLSDSASKELGILRDYIKKTQSGGDLEYRKADVTDHAAMHALMKEIADKHGRLDVCVANAGILGPVVDCHEYPVDWFRKIMEVNVTGVFITAQAAAKQMLEKKIHGSIIFTASMSGSIINKDMHWIPYTTSKAAVIQLAKGFAAELGPFEIRVNCISPGHIRTKMTEAYLNVEPVIEKNWANQNPMGRLGAVYELRGTLAYLASDASSYTTGSDIQVCGGHTSW